MRDRMHEERSGAPREELGRGDLLSALSRREFVGGVAAVAGTAVLSAKPATLLAAGAAPESAPQTAPQTALQAAAARAAPAARAPVVGFHMDRPFLDPTGMAEPYVPPSGMRSGQALAELTEREFLSRHPYG